MDRVQVIQNVGLTFHGKTDGAMKVCFVVGFANSIEQQGGAEQEVRNISHNSYFGGRRVWIQVLLGFSFWRFR